jgi:2-polyprenyl-3-methyl-5-hydroxy-6-metoxy-1,4-benzoquinol methylase
MDSNKNYFESNKKLWNERTSFHAASDFYDLEGFKKGRTSIKSIELDELSDIDIKGKSLLHLQCHFGMDTLSWARAGAKATGVDISDEAIKLARKLNDELHLDANFVCANVYDIPKQLPEEFDIVFTSYGTVGWLPDLDKWAEVIAASLKKGGTFFIADFHPVLWMFDDLFRDIIYSYFNKGVIRTEIAGTYADRNADVHSVEFGWNHSMSEIIGSLIKHGLKITSFNEYPYSPFNCFRNMVKQGDHYMIKHFENKLPMVFTIRAVKE